MTNQIIEVESKVIRGIFFWCGSTDTYQHYIRSSKIKKSIDVLYLTYKKLPGIDYYTLRQNGNNFDFQHNTYPEQQILLISLFEISKRQDLDLNKPFYLFSQDLKHSSKPIYFLNDILSQKGDSFNCFLCSNYINYEDLAILSCGHSFHNQCVLQHTTSKQCNNCEFMINNRSNFIYSDMGMTNPDYKHYFDLKCPRCQQCVI